jgi:hypothetical protein
VGEGGIALWRNGATRKEKEKKSNGVEVQSVGIRQGPLSEGEALVRLSSSLRYLVV